MARLPAAFRVTYLTWRQTCPISRPTCRWRPPSGCLRQPEPGGSDNPAHHVEASGPDIRARPAPVGVVCLIIPLGNDTTHCSRRGGSRVKLGAGQNIPIVHCLILRSLGRSLATRTPAACRAESPWSFAQQRLSHRPLLQTSVCSCVFLLSLCNGLNHSLAEAFRPAARETRPRRIVDRYPRLSVPRRDTSGTAHTPRRWLALCAAGTRL